MERLSKKEIEEIIRQVFEDNDEVLYMLAHRGRKSQRKIPSIGK